MLTEEKLREKIVYLLSELAIPFSEKDLSVTRLAQGGSDRVFYRVRVADETFVLMTSPPMSCETRAYYRIGRFLFDSGVGVPEIFSFDEESGILLMEDLGDDEAQQLAVADYIFEPTKEYIVRELIPRSLKLQFYKAILDSSASEHGARMTAMHKATDNATELIKELGLQYNKARQATITNEIIEIVGGAEALNG